MPERLARCLEPATAVYTGTPVPDVLHLTPETRQVLAWADQRLGEKRRTGQLVLRLRFEEFNGIGAQHHVPFAEVPAAACGAVPVSGEQSDSKVARRRTRSELVGNAASVPAAAWHGERMRSAIYSISA